MNASAGIFPILVVFLPSFYAFSISPLGYKVFWIKLKSLATWFMSAHADAEKTGNQLDEVPNQNGRKVSNKFKTPN